MPTAPEIRRDLPAPTFLGLRPLEWISYVSLPALFVAALGADAVTRGLIAIAVTVVASAMCAIENTRPTAGEPL